MSDITRPPPSDVNHHVAQGPQKPIASKLGAKGSKKKPGADKANTEIQPPELMRFQECARDASVCVKTIERWVAAGFLTEWRPHPDSRTRRITRLVWKAFKKRFR